ncbi:MAG: CUAEP/CCAEP-tail radical SAM protein [Chloroflexota bacterium]|nr:CUAEP/CCAEP-tail radical SAM protein [Chloroflexota bacterium]
MSLSATTTAVTSDANGDLRMLGAVLLVSCYELGHQPLALAIAAASLRAEGFDPAVVDLAVEELSDDGLARARLVAVSVPMHTAMRIGQGVLNRIRVTSPETPVVFYGLYAVLNADHLFEAGATAVIGGEFDAPLRQIAAMLASGGDLVTAAIPGVMTSDNRSPDPPARSAFPTPDRAGLPVLRSYAGLEREGTIVPAGYVEATRGCHHTCTHCPITPVYGGRLVVVPRDRVLDDIAQQVKMGSQHITFGDPDFFNGPAHSLRILREMRERWPGLTFDATIKIEHLIEHRQRLPELAELGCQFIVSAVESLNEEALRRMRKGHDAAMVADAIALLDEIGVPMRPSLLPFSPWETLESYLDLLHFMAGQGMIRNIDPVHWSIRLLIPPGSAVLDDPDTAAWVGPLDPEALTYEWTHLDPRMEALQREVARLAETGDACQQDPAETFEAIWHAAHRTAGIDPPKLPVTTGHRPRSPRLTESWFC